MGRQTKVNFQGRLVDGEEMDFKSKEEWIVIEVSDGAILRLKPVPVSIVKVFDQYDPLGNPVYVVNASNIMSVSVPEELKKGAERPKEH